MSKDSYSFTLFVAEDENKKKSLYLLRPEWCPVETFHRIPWNEIVKDAVEQRIRENEL